MIIPLIVIMELAFIWFFNIHLAFNVLKGLATGGGFIVYVV